MRRGGVRRGGDEEEVEVDEKGEGVVDKGEDIRV